MQVWKNQAVLTVTVINRITRTKKEEEELESERWSEWQENWRSWQTSLSNQREKKKGKKTEGQSRNWAAGLLLHHSALLMIELKLSTGHILKILEARTTSLRLLRIRVYRGHWTWMNVCTFLIFIFILCAWVFICMYYVCHMCVWHPQRSKDGPTYSESDVTSSCEPECRC